MTTIRTTKLELQTRHTNHPQGGLVSIIIPFWNAGTFLREAIESVLVQDYENWELILVDDGSADESTEVAHNYAFQYPGKIRVVEHEAQKHCGVSSSRNLGLLQVTGDYICFLDADDVFLQSKLSKEVEVLQNNPAAVVVCGAYYCWFSWTGAPRDTGRDFIVQLGVEPDRIYQPPDLLVHNLRAGGRKPGTSGIMFRREYLLTETCDASFVGMGDDQVFWSKFSLEVPIFVTNDVLFRYRQHSDSLCARAMKTGADLIAWQRYLAWLDEYLTSHKIVDPNLWKALGHCQRNIAVQIKLAPIKLVYRRLLPLRTRYWLRDRWIKLQSRLRN